MTAKKLNKAMKGMKVNSWEVREYSNGRRKLYVRYIPATPEIRTKAVSVKKRSA